MAGVNTSIEGTSTIRESSVDIGKSYILINRYGNIGHIQAEIVFVDGESLSRNKAVFVSSIHPINPFSFICTGCTTSLPDSVITGYIDSNGLVYLGYNFIGSPSVKVVNIDISFKAS